MVRGDRYYTTDFTRKMTSFSVSKVNSELVLVAANLTAWGYQDCMRDSLNGGFGSQSMSTPTLLA